MTKQELLTIVETLKEFKSMLWGQTITMYTDHKNLMQDALGLTSEWVYRWRLLLEEYGSTIVYIMGIHNTVVDAISQLVNGPIKDNRPTWKTCAQCWCYHNSTQQHEASVANSKESMNLVFANQSKEDTIYPLTTREIVEAQQDNNLKTQAEKEGYSTQLVKNIEVLCKQGKMVIPKSPQHRAVVRFHQYLQHPDLSRMWCRFWVDKDQTNSNSR